MISINNDIYYNEAEVSHKQDNSANSWSVSFIMYKDVLKRFQ